MVNCAVEWLGSIFQVAVSANAETAAKTAMAEATTSLRPLFDIRNQHP
jgi:hypothetical protein